MDIQALRMALSEKNSCFILAGWSDPWMAGIALARILRGFSFSILTDCPDPRPRPFLKEFFRTVWLKYLFPRATYAFVASESGTQLLHVLGCAPEKIICFSYWVPLHNTSQTREESSAQPAHQGPVRFFCLGRLIPRKRFDLSVRALQAVIQEFGPGCATLTIAGTGPQQASLERLVMTAALQRHVRFTGWQEHPDAIRALRESDVLIHPADWEPYGVVVLEAMAHAKPVIATKTTMAAVDRIRHGVNGFLFEKGDAQALAVCMSRLIRDRQAIPRMGAEAWKTSEAWPVERGVKILERLLGKEGLQT